MVTKKDGGGREKKKGARGWRETCKTAAYN